MCAFLSDNDMITMQSWFDNVPDTTSVLDFVPSDYIQKLNLSFDINKLRDALDTAIYRLGYDGNYIDKGFAGISLTKRHTDNHISDNDQSGRYYMRVTSDDQDETVFEDLVDEENFSHFVPELQDTYFYDVHQRLSQKLRIGRMRILYKGVYNCNSWHRDPEPRLHIPIITNPGSLFIINHHCTHLPADGSVYFTDTRGYHTALNGGTQPRIHIVIAVIGVR